MKTSGITHDSDRHLGLTGIKGTAGGLSSNLSIHPALGIGAKDGSASLSNIPNSQRQFSKVRPMTGKAPEVAHSFAAGIPGPKPAGFEYTPMGIQAAGALVGEPGQFGQIGTRYRNHSKQQSQTVFSSGVQQTNQS